MIRVRSLLESLSPNQYKKTRKRIELAMLVITPIIVSLSGLQIISHLADGDDEFFIKHEDFARWMGLLIAFLKTPADIFVTVLFFSLTNYFVLKKKQTVDSAGEHKARQGLIKGLNKRQSRIVVWIYFMGCMNLF